MSFPVKRENDPATGIINGLGIAFIMWGILFILAAIVRWLA